MGIRAGDPRNGPQVSKFAMDRERRREHDALTEAMHEHEPDVPCLNVSGPYAPDWLAEDPEGQREAARLCRSCPVLERCRAYGMRYAEQGVWGGMSKGMRSKHGGEYRRQLEAEAAATAEAAAAERTAATQQETAEAAQHTGQETADHGSDTRGLATTGEQGQQLRERNRLRRAEFRLEQSNSRSDQSESSSRRSEQDPAAAGGRRPMTTNQQQAERPALAVVQRLAGMPDQTVPPRPRGSNLRPASQRYGGMESGSSGESRADPASIIFRTIPRNGRNPLGALKEGVMVRECELFGCSQSLAGQRSDAHFCCPAHRKAEERRRARLTGEPRHELCETCGRPYLGFPPHCPEHETEGTAA